jgi:arylsulfatase A-like enzyme
LPVFSVKALFLAVLFLFVVILTVLLFHYLFNRKIRCGLVLVFWLLSLLCYFIQPSSSDEPSKETFISKGKPIPYIIIITIDSLRKDAVSSYNTDHQLTPNIDKFSKESYIFTRAIAPTSWTLPSMASMMTGMPPEVHQATRHHHKVTEKLPTLPGQLRKAGYYTAAIGINPTLSKKTNISQGFIYYDFYPKFSTGRSLGSKIRKHLFTYVPAEKLADVTSEHLELDFKSFISTDKLTDLSIEWIRSNKEKNFFLWIHYFDPHVPYSPPKPYIKKASPSLGDVFDRPDDILTKSFVPDRTEREWIKSLYLGEVKYIDHNIGRLLEAMKGMGIYENSFIILTSDHGEEFWDHGEYYHGHSLYNELIQIPLIIKVPGKKEKKRVERRISLEHLLPTIMDLCGLEMNNRDLYKPSFLSLLGNKNEPFPESPIICSSLRYGVEREAVFFGNFKYIISGDEGQVELYDILSDPLEQSSQAERNPQQISLGKDFLKNRFIWVKKTINKFKIEVVERNKKSPSKQIDNLKSLGYF